MEILRVNEFNSSSKIARKVGKLEEKGLKTLKQNIEEFLKADNLNENSNTEVRQFLEKAKVDDALLGIYLRGRKNDPQVAWDTIRHYAENKFQLYPEIFPTGAIPDTIRKMFQCHMLGVLKNCDKLGRRIVFVDMSKWDTNEYTMDDVTIAGVLGCERFWQEEDVMKNGVIMIENTKGFGVAHAKLHTIPRVMRMRNVFLYSFPIAVKGLYYINVPTIFSYGAKMVKPLFPKKLRSRMFMYSANQTPTELFEIAPPEILPTWIGGTLSIEEAAEDLTFFENTLGLSS